MDNTATLRQEIKQLMVENLMLQSEEADLFVAACLRGVLLPDALQHFDQSLPLDGEFHSMVCVSGFWRRLFSRRPPGVA